MEFNRCSRCGSFFVSQGNVCPKCSAKDGVEFSNFVNYIQENGFTDSLDTISGQIGVSVKNLNRFLEYEDFKQFKSEMNNTNGKKENLGNTGISLN